MATIKAMVAEKLRKDGGPTDDEVRKAVKQYLKCICAILPGENNSDKNPIGAEFAKLMLPTMFPVKEIRSENVKGDDLHEQAVNKLIEKIMDDRDDLSDCPCLRQELVGAMKRAGDGWAEAGGRSCR